MMSRLFSIAVLLTAIPLSGCSSVIDGTTQTIIVATHPEGANCALVRENVVIGRVNQTPGAAVVKKSKHDISIQCAKDGYASANYLNKSDAAGATLANVALGGVVGIGGWAIDSATGADNKYQTQVDLTLMQASR